MMGCAIRKWLRGHQGEAANVHFSPILLFIFVRVYMFAYITAYEQSLRLGFALPSSRVRDIARCHAMLGEKDAALTALERAFALGYRRIDLIRNDPAFESLRAEPRFQTLVATVDTS